MRYRRPWGPRVDSLERADGTAHVAMGAGVLVEAGAPPRRLGEVLLAALPDVLRAARRYADRCLAGPPASSAGESPGGSGEEAPDDVLVAVDGHAIRRGTFRAHQSLASGVSVEAELSPAETWTALERARAAAAEAGPV